MSSDSTSDEHGEFDFGAWCPVCERQITTSTPEVNEPAPTHQASLKKSKGKAGQQVKRRPSTKKKTNSSSSLRALTAVTEPEQLEPPSELYCSDECRRIDEMRSRLALSNIGEPAYRPPMMARSLSGTSSKDGWDALNFTTRRPSRGVVGGYSYRPSLMARVPSNQDPHRPISNASSDSLASLGMADADERSERGYGGTRPPSALSSFRFMTPIQSPLASPQVPTSTSQAATHPPAARGRQRTLMPRAQSENTVVQQHPRRSQSSTGKKALPMASPPLASPEPGPSSVPSSSLLLEMLPPPLLIQTKDAHQFHRRNGSSASLALLGSSLSRSHGSKNGWAAPQRTGSTLSLSGLVAQGTILPQHEVAAPTPTMMRRTGSNHAAATTTTNVTATSRLATSPSSVSSASTAWSASQRSTATSNEHDYYSRSFSSSHSHSHSHDEDHKTKRRISSRGLTMTPSSSSLKAMSVVNDTLAENTPTQPLTMTASTSTRPLAPPSRSEADTGTIKRPARPLKAYSETTGIEAQQVQQLAKEEHARMTATGPGRKNWTWDQAGVATYAALDLTSQSSSLTKERKRLFYFDDASSSTTGAQ